MPVRNPLVIVAIALVALARPASTQEALTIERITSQPYLSGTSPTRPTWSPDSSQIAFLWNENARAFRDVYVWDGGELRRVTRFGDEEDATGGGVSELVWTPDGKALIVAFGGTFHRVESDASDVASFGDLTGYAPAFSPDGRQFSFLRDGDLWLKNETTG